MNRTKKLKLNVSSSIVYQIIVLSCGLILPRFYLISYGSSINGLISSLKQFLGFISILELGMGAVVQTTLYKPLAEKDVNQISKIYIKANAFFRNIIYVFVGYIIILCIVYPNIQNEFENIFVISLILILSISSFAQYYFGIVNQLLIGADQAIFVTNIISIFVTILNTIICIVLMKINLSITLVMLFSSFIFVIRPLLLNTYVKKNYTIDRNVIITSDPIPGKKSGFIHHFSFFVLMQTDVALLTVFSDFITVSIYSVYSMVITGLKNVVISPLDGFQSLYGNMAVKEELKELSSTFKFNEWLLHNIVVFLFGCCAFLIVPFVSVYTQKITDANYLNQAFGYFMSIAGAGFIFRQLYFMPIKVFGYYKQTQQCAIIEMTLNLIVSIVLLSFWGINGVAIGTAVAVFYKVIYLIMYLPKIFDFSGINTLKYFLIDIVNLLIFRVISNILPTNCANYIVWFLIAILYALVFLFILVLTNIIFYKNNMKRIILKLISYRRK